MVHVMTDLRQQRRTQLFVCAVITVALCALALVIGIAIAGYQKEMESPLHESDRRYMGLPPAPDCSHVYNVGRPDEWQKCMGVEKRSWE